MPASSAGPTEPARAARPAVGAPAGFSLIETLVGVAVFVVILFAVYTVYETCQATYWRVTTRAGLNQSARAGLEQMRRELRLVGTDPSATAQPAVQTSSSGVVEFIADVDGDNVSDLVRYERNSGTRAILRTARPWIPGTGWGPARVTTLAEDSLALNFEYFPTAAFPDVKRIRVRIRLSDSTATTGQIQHVLNSDIYLRNL